MIDNITLEKHLKKFQLATTAWSLVSGIIVALAAGYAFYLNTNTTLDDHTKQIKDVRADVKVLTEAVNNSAVFQGASKEQIKALQDQVTDVKVSQSRIEDKLDKLILKAKD